MCDDSGDFGGDGEVEIVGRGRAPPGLGVGNRPTRLRECHPERNEVESRDLRRIDTAVQQPGARIPRLVIHARGDRYPRQGIKRSVRESICMFLLRWRRNIKVSAPSSWR